MDKLSPKLSLSKKLDGGYLHIKKRNSLKSYSKSKIKGGYKEYLNKMKGGSNQTNQTNQHKTTKRDNTNQQKVLAIKLGGTKKRSKKNKPKNLKKNPINNASKIYQILSQ